MGFWEAIVVISLIAIISDTIVKLSRQRSKGLEKKDQEYIESLEKKVNFLQKQIAEVRDETDEIHKQADKLEEHYDFINRLLKEKNQP